MADLRPLTRVPEPRVVGSLLAFRDDRLALLRRAFEADARIALAHLGPIPLVLVNDPDLAHEVLVARPADFVKFQVRGMPASQRLLGAGILQSEGDEHRRRRRRLMPAFLPARVARYAAAMADETEGLQATWADGAEIALDEEMERLTLAIFGRTLFGVDLREDAGGLGAAITEVIRIVVGEALRFVHLPLAWPTSEHRRFRRALATIEGTLDALAQARRREASPGDDLLSVLVRAADEPADAADGERAMTDVEVREELLNLVVAGFEATATSLTWSLYLLARDPARASHLADETRVALGGRTPTHDDLARLPGAMGVFKEAMRLYPAAHILVRQTARPLDLDGHRLAEGVAVFVNGYAIHRRADLWSDAESFAPERFALDRVEGAASGALKRTYFPFGIGPRTCIGNHFALLEGHVVLATLAQRVAFELTSDAAPGTVAAFALRPRGALRARVRRVTLAARG